MKNNKLTEIEATILRTCLNYNDRESQLDDNFSNGGIEEFEAALPDLNRNQIGAHMTNLIKRGYITEPDPESRGIVWISEDGVNAIFRSEERRVGKECRSRWGRYAEQ